MGTVNELVMLAILALINVSYINATDKDPSTVARNGQILEVAIWV